MTLLFLGRCTYCTQWTDCSEVIDSESDPADPIPACVTCSTEFKLLAARPEHIPAPRPHVPRVQS